MSQSPPECVSELSSASIAPLSKEFEISSQFNELLPALLDQSLDCVKLICRDGRVQYMNRNGLCAMEIDNLSDIMGQQWIDLWPGEARELIQNALANAAVGPVRFDAHCPTAKGSPRWWDVSVSRVEDNEGRWLGYLSVSRDVTAARLAKEVADISAAEMRHRLKNSYAMVSGLLSSLARGNAEREQFVGEIRDRLAALGVAQTLFVASENAPCDIRELLPALLNPFSHAQCPIAVASLPEAVVNQGQADALALVFGEMAVNSSKHGALSSNGTIAVEADVAGDELLIRWSERSSRHVDAHSRTEGQGLRLINRILTARDGSLNVEWVDNGLDALIRLRVA